jgi:hypothetical protein
MPRETVPAVPALTPDFYLGPAVMTPRSLAEVAPELVKELQRLLLREGEVALADEAEGLTIVDRCQCGDSFCASFYTAHRPYGSFAPVHRKHQINGSQYHE